VDDCIFFGSKPAKINAIIAKLKARFDLTIEATSSIGDEDVFEYLGVKVRTNGQTGKMTHLQAGLINKVLFTTGMTDCNGKPTPAATHPIVSNVNGACVKNTWYYALVMGMLTYLACNSQPDIQHAVHQCCLAYS